MERAPESLTNQAMKPMTTIDIIGNQATGIEVIQTIDVV